MDPRLGPRGRPFLVVAALTGAACVAARLAGEPSFALVAKPLPMFALAGFVLRLAQGRDRVPVAAALVLSGLGDVLIERPGLFVAAMAAFAAAHVGYVVGFVRTDATRALRLPVLAGVLVYAAGLVSLAYPTLGPLRVPVVGYASVIALMMWRAVARVPDGAGEPPAAAARLTAVAAVTFGLSDSLILLKLAQVATDTVNPVILATYWAAQLGFAWAAAAPGASVSAEGRAERG